MFRVILFTAILGSSLLMGGCATSQPQSPTATQTMSTIPWNQPEPGEGAGMMGGLLNSH